MIWMTQMYVKTTDALRSLRDKEEGQGLVEYALILSLVSIAAILTLGVLGVDVDEVLEKVEVALNGDG
jgi:pilus assembly protein Flp/PilA